MYKLVDPTTEEEVEPDEKLIRSIVEQIGVTENAKCAFRQEIMIRISSIARKGQKFDYTSHERLKEAVENKLFAPVERGAHHDFDPDSGPGATEEDQRGSPEVGRRNELLRYVGTLLTR